MVGAVCDFCEAFVSICPTLKLGFDMLSLGPPCF